MKIKILAVTAIVMIAAAYAGAAHVRPYPGPKTYAPIHQ